MMGSFRKATTIMTCRPIVVIVQSINSDDCTEQNSQSGLISRFETKYGCHLHTRKREIT